VENYVIYISPSVSSHHCPMRMNPSMAKGGSC
jgi:hypothetical protein